MLWMFIFQLEYFSSCENFCNFDEKKYFFQNKVVMHVLNFLLKKLMEPPFSEYLVLLKNRVTFSYSFIFFSVGFGSKLLRKPIKIRLFLSRNYINNTDEIFGYMIKHDAKIEF
jgi:hypothetical protein